MLSYKDSERIIKQYAFEYNKSKIIEIRGLDILKNNIISENVINYIDSKNKYTYYYSLQNKIENVLENLDWECSSFLKREFFDSGKKPMWWGGYYSRSTYYRLKKKYMNDFLRMLYA